MAITSSVAIIPHFSGDVSYSQEFDTASNTSSPGSIAVIALSSGNNAISVPTGVVSCLVIPPSGNTNVLIIKGVNGDTGITISPTDPTFVSLAATQTAFVINASATTTVRLIWS